MTNKIMGLIELAMQFKGKEYASVDFAGHINSVTVFISNSITSKVVKMMVCYLDSDNAEEELDSMKNELEEMLKAKAA